jgi:protein-S-isoprenylcysteine O-methyltransferase Ste14
MPRLLEPATAAASTLIARLVIRRMAADYTGKQTLTPATVALMYGAYAANIGGLALAAHRRSWPLPIPAGLARPAGTALAAAGTAVALGGAGRFGSVRQVSGVEPGALVTAGVYRYTRNPQYLGIVAALAGIGIAARSGLAGAIAASVWAAFNRWIPAEERHLTRIFGDEYRTYMARTRRWL